MQSSAKKQSPKCAAQLDRRMFMPVSRSDLECRGIKQLDIILIAGDAYVDHPSYGAAVIGRVLEHHGYSVGIIAQPDWRSVNDFKRLGQPRLFFGITAGNVDSMVANYTSGIKPRRSDDYSPGGKSGMRPDRAITVYANRVREAFPGVPIIIGGIEASLRRLAHYDYWSDRVRGSILIDSRADALVYGMGEQAIVEIASRLSKGLPIDGIVGTTLVKKDLSGIKDPVELPAFEVIARDHQAFARAFRMAYDEMNPFSARAAVQRHGTRYVVQYPPRQDLSRNTLDEIYALPYARMWHPDYNAVGGVPGFETVRWSITSHRGCSGECAFCALYFHQGRIIRSRSEESIIREVKTLAADPQFKGTITDIGGPTANMYAASCKKWDTTGYCADRKCLLPEKCPSYALGYDRLVRLYRSARSIPRVKNVFVASGLRFDLMVDNEERDYLEELCRFHISGLLKVAPEHGSDAVLALMGKPPFSRYEQFVDRFKFAVQRAGKKSFIVNYFISAHPGATLDETLKLALYLAKRGICPEQIQDFLPSPMTASTCMYFTGMDPFTGNPVYIPRTSRERKMQRALLQYNQPANRKLLIESLRQCNAMHELARFDRGARISHRHHCE
jgi:uncharacterized radical SAM protein YgiQ